jgi:hypothetical protein
VQRVTTTPDLAIAVVKSPLRSKPLNERYGLFATLTPTTRRRDAKKSRPDNRAACILYSERLKASLRHPEYYVALERVLGCLHLDCAGGRASGHGGLDFGLREDLELRRSSIESDAGRARQLVPQDHDLRSDLTGGRQRFYEWAKPHRKAEDGTTARVIAAGVAGPASSRCPVEVPIAGLKQSSDRVGTVSEVEGVQSGQPARGVRRKEIG